MASNFDRWGRPPRDFDEWGRDSRNLDEREREERAGPAFRRWYFGGVQIAIGIGLVIGILWTIAGLWHFHVHRLW